MPDSSGLNYITRGRAWARGWNKYEAWTMNWLVGILAIAVAIGLVCGLLLGILFQFGLIPILLAMVIFGILALMVGITLAKAIIPFLWDWIHDRGLEN